MRPNVFLKTWRLLKRAFSHFNHFNGLKLSAALSYYTVFSIGPLLIVLISLAGIFLGKSAVEGRLYEQIRGLTGNEAALQVQAIIGNIRKSNHGVLGGVIGFVVLVVGASGVFSEIQTSLNILWSAQPRRQSIWQAILTRLISFSLLIGLTFIFLVSLLANALIDLLSNSLRKYFPDSVIMLFYVVNLALILLVISFLFTLIFKILPNAFIRWKDAMVGALVTATLFLVGKFIIGVYLGNSTVGITYGTAASIVILMLWVYYSSIILYFGASFTRMYAESRGYRIRSKSSKNAANP